MRTDTDSEDEYAEIFIDGKTIGTCNPDGPQQQCTYFSCTQPNYGQSVPRQIVSSTTGVIEFRAKYSLDVNDMNCDAIGVHYPSPGIALVWLDLGN